MIEFVLKNRRLRLHPDGVMYSRAHCRGKETKSEKWKEIKFRYNDDGYETCTMSIEGIKRSFLKHRLVKLAHDPTWDIFDSSPDNMIDHINHTRDDNSNENLRVVNHQQNQWNRDAKGYYWREARKKWVSQIALNDKKIYLGQFEKEEDARDAYLAAKAKLHII